VEVDLGLLDRGPLRRTVEPPRPIDLWVEGREARIRFPLSLSGLRSSWRRCSMPASVQTASAGMTVMPNARTRARAELAPVLEAEDLATRNRSCWRTRRVPRQPCRGGPCGRWKARIASTGMRWWVPTLAWSISPDSTSFISVGRDSLSIVAVSVVVNSSLIGTRPRRWCARRRAGRGPSPRSPLSPRLHPSTVSSRRPRLTLTMRRSKRMVAGSRQCASTRET
jgi:hypothetical protein